ncbi:uncharacterized protein IL334_004745 [Kwoniella shivajii]|uniref:Urease accessory protein n=1 Tax=Kwoniella shivajii TaxID=564305 RepID=A0ABZ1D2F0_9TREE|nr:hypothetical protein IL334_004745 [Kwoniella shivajii]
MSITPGTYTLSATPITRLTPGSGILHLSLPSTSTSDTAQPSDSSCSPNGTAHTNEHRNGRSRFSTLSAAYPLKLLSPTPLSSQPSNLSLVYTLAYGGGLVAGDLISLQGEIGSGCGLVMLTQGSTKVYKRRPGIRPQSNFRSHQHPPSSKVENEKEKTDPSIGSDLTRQRLHVKLNSHSFLLLLPDSISPFAKSQYSQTQRFILPQDKTASILILDWVNSGRGQRSTFGEEIWSMEKYNSTNEVFIGDRLAMREKMILDNSSSDVSKQLSPYNIYATLIFSGPHLTKLMKVLKQWSDKSRQFQLKLPPGLVWSFSEIDSESGAGIVRVAGRETEDVRIWLRGCLEAGGVKDLTGDGIWPRCI